MEKGSKMSTIGVIATIFAIGIVMTVMFDGLSASASDTGTNTSTGSTTAACATNGHSHHFPATNSAVTNPSQCPKP